MEVKKIQNKEIWDKWLLENSCFSYFSQSFSWGEILENEGENVERLAIYNKEEILAQAQLIFWFKICFLSKRAYFW